MNTLVRKFFCEAGDFEEVRILTETPAKNFDELISLAPKFPRGWFELSLVPPRDRVEFALTFWLGRLPFQPKAHALIVSFFESLDDVCVVLSKQKGTWTPQLVYSLRDNSSFFRGFLPAEEESLLDLKIEMDFSFPSDWIAFAQIHNGFGKLSEMGVLRFEEIPFARRKVMDMILTASRPVRSGHLVVDAAALIPFFELPGLNSFQCFYADWYPGFEMGNVYFSGIDYTVSETNQTDATEENGAFSTFLEWLALYLEGMEIAP